MSVGERRRVLPQQRGSHVTTRRFELHRDHDVSGVSGTGVVADGVRWPDGSVSIRWRGERPSVVFWHSLEDAEQVHGHGGATRFVWLDHDREAPPVGWAPLLETDDGLAPDGTGALQRSRPEADHG